MRLLSPAHPFRCSRKRAWPASLDENGSTARVALVFRGVRPLGLCHHRLPGAGAAPRRIRHPRHSEHRDRRDRRPRRGAPPHPALAVFPAPRAPRGVAPLSRDLAVVGRAGVDLRPCRDLPRRQRRCALPDQGHLHPRRGPGLDAGRDRERRNAGRPTVGASGCSPARRWRRDRPRPRWQLPSPPRGTPWCWNCRPRHRLRPLRARWRRGGVVSRCGVPRPCRCWTPSSMWAGPSTPIPTTCCSCPEGPGCTPPRGSRPASG